MKYIKSILEKFESQKLSKILGFISKESRNRFLRDIKNISDKLDFPMSELSDEMFTYLPFKKAYDLKNSEGKEYLKFWFNSNGEYITITKILEEETPQSRLVDDFRDLPHLSKIRIDGVDAILYIDGGYHYAIQSELDGGCPTNGNDWKKYGSKSWRLGGGDHGQIYLIDTLKEDDLKDPNIFNEQIDSYLRTIPSSNIRKLLENAEFCLLLDLKSIKNKRSEIKKERELNKPDQTKVGIGRYLDALSKYDKDKDLTQLTSIIPRLLGWAKPSLLIYSGLNISDIRNIMDCLHYIDGGNSRSKYYEDEISTSIKKVVNKTFDSYQIVVKGISGLKKIANQEENKNVIEVIDKLEVLDSLIKKYLYKDISKLSDIKSTMIKVNILYDLLRDSVLSHRMHSSINQIMRGKSEIAYGEMVYELSYNKESIITGLDYTIDTITSLME